MAIAYRSSASGAGGNVTSSTVTVPSSVASGDAILVFLEWNNTQAFSTFTTSTGTTYTLLQEKVCSSETYRIYWAVASGSDASSTLTLTLAAASRQEIHVVAYSGTHATTPVNTYTAIDSSGASTANRVTPNATPNVTGCWGVSFATDKNSSHTSSDTWTADATTTKRTEHTTGGSGSCSGVVADSNATITSGSAYGTKTYTSAFASTNGGSATVIIAPDSTQSMTATGIATSAALGTPVTAISASTQSMTAVGIDSPDSWFLAEFPPGFTSMGWPSTAFAASTTQSMTAVGIPSAAVLGTPALYFATVGSTNWPTVFVEAAFASDPNTAGRVWTDITNYVAGRPSTTFLNIERGRTFELDRVDAGTAQFSLDNRTGRFDPANSASPYFPGVKPMRPFRVQALWAGTLYDLFTGFVERWPQSWDNFPMGWSSPTAVDALASLAGTKMLRPWQGLARTYGATSVYPLSEPAGSGQVVDLLGNGAPGKVHHKGDGTATLGATVTGGTGLALTGGTQGKGWLSFTGPLIGGQPFTFETWFTLTGDPASAGDQVFLKFTSTNPATGDTLFNLTVRTEYALGGQFAVNTYTGDGTSANTISTVTFPTGGEHQLVVTGNTGLTVIQIWLDGNLIATGTHGSTFGATSQGSALVGTLDTLTGYTPSTSFNGKLWNLAFYPTALLSDQIAQLYIAGSTLYDGDRTDVRIQHVLTQAGWTGGTSLAVGAGTMGDADFDGKTALELIQDAGTVEGGPVFADGTGNLTLVSRTALEHQSALYTFGEQEIPYDDVTFDDDPTYIYNDVQVTRTGGGTVTRSDVTSATQYFRRSFSLEVDCETDEQAQAMAEHLLAVYKDHTQRVESLTFTPSTSSSPLAWPAALGLDIGDCIRVNRRPPGAPMITALVVVQQIRHEVASGVWRTTFALTPADQANYARADIGPGADIGVASW